MKMHEVTHHEIIEFTEFDLHHDFFDVVAKSKLVFENTQGYHKLKHALRDFATPVPAIGNKYIYTSVAATPIVKLINIASFANEHKLTGIQSGKYIFYMHGQRKAFPESGSLDQGDSYQHIFTFKNRAEFGELNQWLNLQFPLADGWKVTHKNLG